MPRGLPVQRLPEEVERPLEAAVRGVGAGGESGGRGGSRSGLRALVRLTAGKVPSPRCAAPPLPHRRAPGVPALDCPVGPCWGEGGGIIGGEG